MNSKVRGTCQEMCSAEELKMREKEGLLHRLEVCPDSCVSKRPKAHPNRVVKSFSRSAADANIAKPHLLRPFPVLKKTVNYLLVQVTSAENVSLLSKYDFIADRLRAALRQDMTIQQLPSEECIQLLDPMIRFHVLFGYRLCELPQSNYDPYLNKKHLLECLKHILVCYDEQEKIVDEIRLKNLSLDENELSDNRNLMESLYIICNLFEVEPLLRYLRLPKNVSQDESVMRCFLLSKENMKNNFVCVMKLAKELCPLTCCAFALHLNTIQRKALEILSHAYSSKLLSTPTNFVRDILLFETNNDVVIACRHYGLKAERDSVLFRKGDFDCNKPVIHPNRIHLCNAKIEQPYYNLFTY